MAPRPPLRGYNHNIRYRSRIYHVQTEDSGVDNPHLFTHMYHGGVIIASAKCDYSEHVANEDHVPLVKKMMQAQHKQLMKELRRGAYDEKIVQLLGCLDPEAEGESVIPAADAAPAEAMAPDMAAEPSEAAAQAAPEAAQAPPAEAPLSETAPAPVPPEAPHADTAQDIVQPAAPVAEGEEPITEPLPRFPAVDEERTEVHQRPEFGEPPATFADAGEPLDLGEFDFDAPLEEAPEPPPELPRRRQGSVRIQPPPVEPPSVGTPPEGIPAITAESAIAAALAEGERRMTGRSQAQPRLPRISLDEGVPAPEPGLVVDDPLPPPTDSGTSYSHVRRRRPPANPQGVFDTPLPREAQQPAPRSGVYPIPGTPAPRPPHPEPSVRRPPVASTPQRYTAPSRRNRQRGRSQTGAYRIPAGIQPAQERNLRPSSTYSITPRSQKAPSKAGPVVARPAIVIDGQRDGAPDRQPPQQQAQEQRGGRAAPQPPRSPSRSLPNLFGSDLISERSLDEVILGYLAEEDGEGNE